MDETLKQLHDLHVPELPGFWPPAPGWWALTALAIGIAVLSGLRWYRWRRRRRPFRIALDVLDRLLLETQTHNLSAREFASRVNTLLKRALIHCANRDEAAPLTGEAWLVYLNGIASSDVFSDGAGAALGNGRFARDFHIDPEPLYAAARAVLRALPRMPTRS